MTAHNALNPTIRADLVTLACLLIKMDDLVSKRNCYK
jgi:hypothetical protein